MEIIVNMTKKRFRLIAGVALVWTCVMCASASAAETPIRPGSELTLKQAIGIALRLHPRRMEAEAEAKAAGERVGEARSRLLPQVWGVGEYLRSTDNPIGDTSYFGLERFPRISGTEHDALPSAGQNFGTGNNYLAGMSVSQHLYDFGRVRGLIDESEAERAGAQARLKLADLDLMFDVSRRYFDLLAAGQIVKVYEKGVQQRKAHLHEATVMAKADLKPEIDVYTTQAQLARAELQLIQVRNGADDAKVALDNAMGLSDSAPEYRQADGLGYEKISDQLPQLLKLAFEMRPELNMLKEEARAAGARITEYRSDYFPTVTGTGAYSNMGTGLPAANNFDVGLVITWPIFNGFATEHQVAEAKFRQDAIRHAIEDLRQQVFQQVKSAFLNWQAAFAGIDQAARARDASQIQLQLAEKRYQAGLGNIIELEDAQERYTSDSAAYVNALYTYAVAKAAVDRNSGRALSVF